MVIRLPLAFVLGLIMYMIAMMLTTYDGALSIALQPLMGTILCLIALAALCLLGSPLLITAVWNRWRKTWWLPLLITVLGLAAFVISWHPALRVKLINPDTHETIESFQPALSAGGWLAAMFGIAFCPIIGFSGDRRWI